MAPSAVTVPMVPACRPSGVSCSYVLAATYDMYEGTDFCTIEFIHGGFFMGSGGNRSYLNGRKEQYMQTEGLLEQPPPTYEAEVLTTLIEETNVASQIIEPPDSGPLPPCIY
ncbi:hypothetical protein D1007_39183 [Hordeum vulgare]|nr:hypothetical protein D1007_39183 [Hordeum vulgare]